MLRRGLISDLADESGAGVRTEHAEATTCGCYFIFLAGSWELTPLRVRGRWPDPGSYRDDQSHQLNTHGDEANSDTKVSDQRHLNETL